MTVSTITRMRLLDDAMSEIKEMDPHTAIKKNFVRSLALEGKIPCAMAGRKRLINFDALLAYLASNLPQETPGNVIDLEENLAKTSGRKQDGTKVS